MPDINLEECTDCGHIAPDAAFGPDEAICPNCGAECSTKPVNCGIRLTTERKCTCRIKALETDTLTT